MHAPLPPIRLTRALALRDGKLSPRTVALADGRFSAGPFPEVDLSGYLILPGIVDLHHCAVLDQVDPASSGEDVVDHHDREAAAHGVTTRYISVPWSWERPAALPSVARQRIQGLDRQCAHALIDLRLQLCADPHMVSSSEALLAMLRGFGVSQVLFHDRVTAARDLRQNDPEGFAVWCLRLGGTPSRIGDTLDDMLSWADRVPRHLCHLAEQFDALGVIYGSVGDRSAEAREHLSMIGARLCVDPETAQVAGAARAVGDPVLLSAQSVLRRSTSAHRIDPISLLRRGHCEALVSGGVSSSLLQAAFRLAEKGVMPLAQAWRLVSEAPARILRLPDRGEIAPGRRADLVIVQAHTHRVEATISQGRLAYLSGEAAHRFIGLRQDMRSLAAE